MLVWKAMPSMRAMISLIRADASLISCMVVSTSPMAPWPRRTTSTADRTSWPAWSVAPAVPRTVSVICSMEAEVCCRLAADCSVRAARSWLPRAMSSAAVLTPTALSRTDCRVVSMRPMKASNSRASSPISSPRGLSTRAVRSPSPRVISPMRRLTWRIALAIRCGPIRASAIASRPTRPAKPPTTKRCRRIPAAVRAANAPVVRSTAALACR